MEAVFSAAFFGRLVRGQMFARVPPGAYGLVFRPLSSKLPATRNALSSKCCCNFSQFPIDASTVSRIRPSLTNLQYLKATIQP